jgi:DNA modification methylase
LKSKPKPASASSSAGTTTADKKFSINDFDKVYVGDSRKLASGLHNESVDVTITSPPYFDMKDYGRPNQIGFGQKYEDYLRDMSVVFSEIFRATKPTGSLWIVIDTFRKGQELVPLPFDLARHLQVCGWTLRDIVIWKKERTVPWVQNGATKRIFEYILVLSKGPVSFKYDQDKFRETVDLKRWWVRYPERYNPKGKAPEQIWSYDIPTQGSWGNHYVRHFCPLPQELVSRIVQQTTERDQVVLDPFSGSGTVPTVSKLLGRKYLGFELNADYVEMFKKHLKNELALKKDEVTDSNQTTSNFEQTIILLRLLKYGRLIIRILKKSYPTSAFKMFIFQSSDVPEQKFKHYSAEYFVFVDKKNLAPEISKLIDSSIAHAPLSKFGIQPVFKILTSALEIPSQKRKGTFFEYTATNSHSYSEAHRFENAWNSQGLLFSPIKVEVKEPHG